jgi:hypothetical protein
MGEEKLGCITQLCPSQMLLHSVKLRHNHQMDLMHYFQVAFHCLHFQGIEYHHMVKIHCKWRVIHIILQFHEIL